MGDLGIARPQDLLAGVPGAADALAPRAVPEHGEQGKHPSRRRVPLIAAAQAPEEGALDPAALMEKIEKLNMATKDLRIRFEVRDSFGSPVVQIIDQETGEILRTVPPSAVLNLQDRLPGAAGLLVDAES